MTTIWAVNKAKPKKFIHFTGDFSHPHISKTLDGEYQVYCKLHTSWIKFNLGDYIAFQDENDMYPVDKDYFMEHYSIIYNNPSEA